MADLFRGFLQFLLKILMFMELGIKVMPVETPRQVDGPILNFFPYPFKLIIN
jgi:hypothetical protein